MFKNWPVNLTTLDALFTCLSVCINFARSTSACVVLFSLSLLFFFSFFISFSSFLYLEISPARRSTSCSCSLNRRTNNDSHFRVKQISNKIHTWWNYSITQANDPMFEHWTKIYWSQKIYRNTVPEMLLQDFFFFLSNTAIIFHIINLKKQNSTIMVIFYIKPWVN